MPVPARTPDEVARGDLTFVVDDVPFEDVGLLDFHVLVQVELSTRRPPKQGRQQSRPDISPGLGGFPLGHVYVVQGPRIYEFTQGGSLVGLFATVPTANADHSGITFDREGTFGHKMIVTASTGHVYTVDSSGTVTLLATVTLPGNVAVFHENPEVIPASFGPLGGQVWTAAEHIDTVFAISPSGVVTVVGTSSTFFDRAETVHLIPDSVCNFGTSGGAFFVTDAFNDFGGGHVVKFPATDFGGLGGSVLVAGEGGNPIALISLNTAGTAYVFEIFDTTIRHHEGATFTRCIVVPTIDNEPPTADANGPYDVDEGGSVILDGTASSDTDGSITDYDWDLDNDGFFDDATGATPTFSAAGRDGPDSQTVVLRVTDDDGDTDTAATTVEIKNVVPRLRNTAITSPINEGDIATLSGTIEDPGTPDTFEMEVDWGDGSTETFTFPASSSGSQSFSLQHQYLDDNPDTTPSDDYDVRFLSLEDDDGGQTPTGVGGNIFLTGHDPDFHAQGSAEPGAKNLLAAAVSYARNGSALPMLWVESRLGIPSGHRLGRNGLTSNGIGLVEGVDFVYMDAAQLNTLVDWSDLISNYSAIGVASDFGGILSEAEKDVLIAHKTDIATFINAGGGLVALSECSCSGHSAGADATKNFSFLPIAVTATGNASPPCDVTSFGFTEFGLVPGDVNSPSHSHFDDDFGLEIVSFSPGTGQIMTLAGNVIVTGDTLEQGLTITVNNVPVEIVALSLTSISPIPVDCPAGTVTWLVNGHRYSAIPESLLITWDAADTAAQALTCDGAPGHLVTLTSLAENDFVAGSLPTAVSGIYWIGAFQATEAPAPSPEPAGTGPGGAAAGWEWVTGEPFVFAKWASGEPNDANGNEDVAHFWTPSGEWNDLNRNSARLGYVVEFEIDDVNEGDAVDLNVSFTDVGTQDTHTATIDWGDGAGPQPVLVTQGSGSGSISVPHTYGDNGVLTVTVTVTDDDSGSDSGQATITVLNVDPEVALVDTPSITFPSLNTAFTGRVGVSQSHDASADDPGSDDLTFDWTFAPDAFTASNVHLNDGAFDPDPDPSPTINPRNESDSQSVTFSAAGVYDVKVNVTDDDLGNAMANQPKVVVDDCDCTKSQGFWKKQFKGKKDQIDDATLQGYLDIIRFGSGVFGVLPQVPLDTPADANNILNPRHGSGSGSSRSSGGKKREKALAQTLAAWLNYAKGSIDWTEVVEGTGLTFGDLIGQVEAIVNDPGATDEQLEHAKDLAEAVNKHDKGNPECDTGTGSNDSKTQSATKSDTDSD